MQIPGQIWVQINIQALDYIFDSDHETASEEIRLGILKNTDFNDWYIYSYSGS